MSKLRRGCGAFLDSACDAAGAPNRVLDAPAGASAGKPGGKIDAAYGLGLVIEGLQAAMEAGAIERRPIEVLAHILLVRSTRRPCWCQCP